MYLFEPAACADARPAAPSVGIPRGMPFVLTTTGTPAAPVNRWLRSLPTAGVPAAKSWLAYATRPRRPGVRFLHQRELDLVEDAGGAAGGGSRLPRRPSGGELGRRLAASSWNRAVPSVSRFYDWAHTEGLVDGRPVPLQAVRGTGRRVGATDAAAQPGQGAPGTAPRQPALAGAGLPRAVPRRRSGRWSPRRRRRPRIRGRERRRNAAAGDLAASSGLRAQELSHLLVWEMPAAAPRS